MAHWSAGRRSKPYKVEIDAPSRQGNCARAKRGHAGRVFRGGRLGQHADAVEAADLVGRDGDGDELGGAGKGIGLEGGPDWIGGGGGGFDDEGAGGAGDAEAEGWAGEGEEAVVDDGGGAQGGGGQPKVSG